MTLKEALAGKKFQLYVPSLKIHIANIKKARNKVLFWKYHDFKLLAQALYHTSYDFE